jgi:phage major head subunit gpT-like protein
MVKGTDLVRYQHLFRLEYNRALGELDATTAWDAMNEIAMEVTSDGSEEDYRWLQENPEFQEWVGDRDLGDLKDYKFTIRNIDFQAAVKIFKNEIEDDKMNLVLPRVRGMANGERRKWGKLIHTIMLAGTTGLAYDAVAYFSDVSGDRNNDNLLASVISLGTPTLAQIAVALRDTRVAMLGFKNSRGEIIGVVPDTFVVPPNLEMGFLQLMTSNSDPSLTNAGTVNPYKSWVKRVIVDPGLSDGNDFYAFATKFSVGPFVKQKRQEVETVLDDTFINVNKSLFFGADFRGNVGYGLPILAAKVVSGTA